MKKRLTRDPVYLKNEAPIIALGAVLEKLFEKQIEVEAGSLDDHHLHVLGRFPDHRPRHWVGLAKKNSAWAVKDAGLAQPGGIWARRGLCKPIKDRAHFENTVEYIPDHANRGAVIWQPGMPIPGVE